MSYIAWLRGRVGRRKVFLVFAMVLLRDGNGRILTIQRQDNKAWAQPDGFRNLGAKCVAVFRVRVVGGRLAQAGREVAALCWLTPAQFLARTTGKIRPLFANGLQYLDSGTFVC